MIYFLVALAVPITLMLLIYSSNNDYSNDTMKMPKGFAYLGSVSASFLLVLEVLCIIQNDTEVPLWGNILLSGSNVFWMCISIFLVIHTTNWRLTLGKDKLIYKNSFGVTKTYDYSQITRVMAYYPKSIEKSDFPRKPQYAVGYVIRIGKRKISIEQFADGFDCFEQKIKNRLRRAGNRLDFEIKYTRMVRKF